MINKILSILCVFILVSCLFINNNVFAANTVDVIDIEDEALFNLIYQTEEYKSGDYYFVVGRNDVSYYKIVFLRKTDNLKAYVNNFSGSEYYIYYSVGIAQSIYRASKNPTELTLMETKDSNKSNKLYNSKSGEFYANFDIYSDNTYTDFFFKAPIMEQELTMAQILEQNNPVQTFSNLMKNVVVSLVVFLVGLVAFLKAWTWLKSQLRQG